MRLTEDCYHQSYISKAWKQISQIILAILNIWSSTYFNKARACSPCMIQNHISPLCGFYHTSSDRTTIGQTLSSIGSANQVGGGKPWGWVDDMIWRSVVGAWVEKKQEVST